MEVRSTLRFGRISPHKVGDLAREIRGKSVSEALSAMQFSHRKGALLLLKTLKAAVANAENNKDMSAEDLVVKTVAVEHGPSMRRYHARSRGMASPIRKRMCHIRIVLANEDGGAEGREDEEAAKGAK